MSVIDILGIGGVAVLGYLAYEVCKVDREMCRLGIIGLLMVVMAYVGRYVDVSRSVYVFVLLISVVIVVAILAGRL